MIQARYKSQPQLGSSSACSVLCILTLRTAEMLLNAVPLMTFRQFLRG